eukprot:gene24392-17340_t
MHTALTRVTRRVVQHPWITGAAAGGRFLTGSRVAAAATSDGDGGGAAAGPGYTSIGSFHSDDIEVLQRLPAAEYAAPTVPFSTETVDASFAKLPAAAAAASPPSSAPPLSFGRELKEEFFMLNKDWTFEYAEMQPLRFFDRVLLPHLTHSLRVMADFVNADPSDVVLVQNATAGMNAVLQSMAGGKGGVLQPGDRVFMLDT